MCLPHLRLLATLKTAISGHYYIIIIYIIDRQTDQERLDASLPLTGKHYKKMGMKFRWDDHCQNDLHNHLLIDFISCNRLRLLLV